jgi:anti-anti-sigma factor
VTDEPLARIEVEDGAGALTVVVHGEIDLSNADHMQGEVESATADLGAEAALIIDLSAVEYIDSRGLRLFYLVMKDMRARNVEVLLVASPESFAAEALTLSGIEFYPTRDVVRRGCPGEI